MFRGWGFLLGEIWVLLALAALLGLFVGWLIWGRRVSQVVVDTEQLDRVRGELAAARRQRDERASRVSTLEAELAAAQSASGASDADAAASADAQARIASLEADLQAAREAAQSAEGNADAAAALAQATANLEACQRERAAGERRISDLEAEIADCRASSAAAAVPSAPPVATAVAATPEPAAEPAPAEGRRPEALAGPRGGQADDLKRIKGIGPKLEKLCNTLGFYHFDQVAAWTEDEVAWVDQNLEGFKGRVTRDEWVAQAKVLAND